MSLYRGPGSIDSLDLRTDFVRVWQNQRANFFNGTWSSQPWYALLGNTRQMGVLEHVRDRPALGEAVERKTISRR